MHDKTLDPKRIDNHNQTCLWLKPTRVRGYILRKATKPEMLGAAPGTVSETNHCDLLFRDRFNAHN